MDVAAWLYTAKYWLEKAIWLREMNVVAYESEDPSAWPVVAQAAAIGLVSAKESLNGDLGYLDGTKVETLIKIQKALKLVCEGLALGVEQSGLVKIPKDYDPSEDSNVVPQVPTWPNPFAALGKLGMIIPVGLAVVAVVVLSGGRK